MAKLPTAQEVYGTRKTPRGDNTILGYSTAAAQDMAATAGSGLKAIGGAISDSAEGYEREKKRQEKELEIQNQKKDALNFSRAKSELLRARIEMENAFVERDDYNNFQGDAAKSFKEIKDKYNGVFTTEAGKVNWDSSYNAQLLNTDSKIRKLVKNKNDKALASDMMNNIAENNIAISQTSDLGIHRDLIESNQNHLNVLLNNNIIDKAKHTELRHDMNASYTNTWIDSQDARSLYDLIREAKENNTDKTGTPLDYLGQVGMDEAEKISLAKMKDDINSQPLDRLRSAVEAGVYSNYPDDIQSTVSRAITNKIQINNINSKMRDLGQFDGFLEKYITKEIRLEDFQKAKLEHINDPKKLAILDNLENSLFTKKPEKKDKIPAQEKADVKARLMTQSSDLGVKKERDGTLKFSNDELLMDEVVDYMANVSKYVKSGHISPADADNGLAFASNVITDIRTHSYDTKWYGGFTEKAKIYQNSSYKGGFDAIETFIANNPSINDDYTISKMLSSVPTSMRNMPADLPRDEQVKYIMEKSLEKIIPNYKDLEKGVGKVFLSNGAVINLPVTQKESATYKNNVDIKDQDSFIKDQYKQVGGGTITKAEIQEIAQAESKKHGRNITASDILSFLVSNNKVIIEE